MPQLVGLDDLLMFVIMPRKDVLKALDTHLAAWSLGRLAESASVGSVESALHLHCLFTMRLPVQVLDA